MVSGDRSSAGRLRRAPPPGASAGRLSGACQVAHWPTPTSLRAEPSWFMTVRSSPLVSA
jgi:hypothetical protein